MGAYPCYPGPPRPHRVALALAAARTLPMRLQRVRVGSGSELDMYKVRFLQWREVLRPSQDILENAGRQTQVACGVADW